MRNRCDSMFLTTGEKTNMNKTYKVICDGHEITRLELTPEQYVDQKARDIVRDAVAKSYSVPKHYLRMVRVVEPYVYVTDMNTGLTERREK